MSRKATIRPARERSDIGNPAMPASGLARMTEVTGLATAASAAAFGMLQAHEAHARAPMERVDDIKFPEPKSADAAEADSASIVPQVEAICVQDRELDHLTSSRVMPVAQKPEPAPGVAEPHQANALPDAHLAQHAPAVDEQALIQHVAHQMTAGISNFLDVAAKGEIPAEHVQGLAQNIVETATSLVGAVKAQFDSGIIQTDLAGVVQHAISPAADVASGIDEHVAGALDASGSGVIDLLDGQLGVPVVNQVPLNDIVSNLSGLPNGPAPQLPDVLATVSAIPASVLGGGETSGGPLTDIFYDDGGGALDLSYAATTTLPDVPPVDIGFAGQAVDAVHELTGMFHGGSALHLV